MRIGLTGWGTSVDKVVAQAERAEADGFTSLWYTSVVTGDPLVAMAIAGRRRAGSSSAPRSCRPTRAIRLLQANRAASVVDAMARPGLTLGIGPSHQPLIEDVFGLAYDHPGRNTEEYVRILTSLLAGEAVDVDGDDWTAHTPGWRGLAPPPGPGARLGARPPPAPSCRLRGGRHRVVDGCCPGDRDPCGPDHHRRRCSCRPADPADRGRAAGRGPRRRSRGPQRRRHLLLGLRRHGELPTHPRDRRSLLPAEAAIVGDEGAVERQLRSLLDAGATDIWAAVFPAGDDGRASMQRTMELLKQLACE